MHPPDRDFSLRFQEVPAVVLDERLTVTLPERFSAEVRAHAGTLYPSWREVAHLPVVRFVRYQMLAQPDLARMMWPSQTDELWRAIVDAPDDDAPRLVYADHLLAHGDARGELITIQCSTADDAGRREAELLEDRGALLGSLRFATRSEFQRGLLDDVRFEGIDVRQLHVILGSAEADLVSGLHVGDCAIGDVVGEAVASALNGTLRHLGRLTINRSHVGDAALLELVDARVISTLNLSGNEIGNAALVELGRRSLHGLHALDLSFNRFDGYGFAQLSRAHFPDLEWLDVTSNRIGAAYLDVFAAEFHAPRLRSLDLSWCELGANGAQVLAHARGLRPVEDLDLRGNDIGDAGFAYLVRHGTLDRVRTLWVGNNELGDHGLDALVEAAPRLPQLAKVTWENNPLTDAGLTRFLASPLAGRLTTFGIWGTHELSDAGVAAYEARFSTDR